MKIITANHKVLTSTEDIRKMVETVEAAARTCYQSESNGDTDAFVKKLIDNGHEAMLEHSMISVKFTIDRAMANELTRHRMASFAQESTRYCNYSKDKFDNEITFVEPDFPVPECGDKRLSTYSNFYTEFYDMCKEAERYYFKLLEMTGSPQYARAALPLCTKTDLWITANFREWRHILKLRCAPSAHPDLRMVMLSLLTELYQAAPVIFEDIYNKNFKKLLDEAREIADSEKMARIMANDTLKRGEEND